MDNSMKDIDSLSIESDSETQFLQQIKECQEHLHCMEKLFYDLQKGSNNDKQSKESLDSLNEFNQTINNKYKLSRSMSDLQLMMHELESKMNSKHSLSKESESTRSQIPLNIQAEAVNSNLPSPLTFIIQVPNSIINLLNKKISNDHLFNPPSEYLTKQIFRTRRKIRLISLFQKLFKKKKNNIPSTAETEISNIVDFLQLLRDKNEETVTNSFKNSNTSGLNCKSVIKDNQFTESIDSENSTNLEKDSKTNTLKESPNLVFPIIYNFDEKSDIEVKPNLTIQHEIIPQSNSKSCSYSIKITNEIPLQCLKPADISTKKTENEKSELVDSTKEVQPGEVLLENLNKTLFKTSQSLNSLEAIKTLLENLNEKELKVKKSYQSTKNVEINNILQESKNSKALNHLLQHIMVEIESKMNESKPLHKNVPQIPKRQSSKLSVCSSGSVSSDEELYKKPKILKPKHIQRHTRCHSPSMLNYLVCQSERDIDENIH